MANQSMLGVPHQLARSSVDAQVSEPKTAHAQRYKEGCGAGQLSPYSATERRCRDCGLGNADVRLRVDHGQMILESPGSAGAGD